MPEPGEATLQVSYRGAEIAAQTLQKLFAAILREIEKSGTPGAEQSKTAPTAKDRAKPLGQEVHAPGIDRAASELRGRGVQFQVLKQPGPPPEHTLVFKGKDLSAIARGLKALEDDARTIEKTPERAALTPRDKGEPGGSKGKPRIFTGKDLQDDIRMAREAAALRNAQRALSRPPKGPDRGLDR